MINIFQKKKYQLDISSKSVIIELYENNNYTGKYFCDFTIYNSISEAKGNSKCMEFTLEEYAWAYPIEVSYKTLNRPDSDLCETKTLITRIGDRNGTGKFITHYAKQFGPINNDICLFNYFETRDAIVNQVKTDGREKEPAFTQELVFA